MLLLLLLLFVVIVVVVVVVVVVVYTGWSSVRDELWKEPDKHFSIQ